VIEALLKYLGSVPADKAGLWVATFVAALAKFWFPFLSRLVTRAFQGKARELTALDQRELEREHDAQLFQRDAQIARQAQRLEAAETERDRLALLVEVLEEGKLEAEMELATYRIERKTGQHRSPPRGVPKMPRALDDELDTDRPRSASRALPPPRPPDSDPPPTTPVVPGPRGRGRR
jgi:hypothetical protein